MGALCITDCQGLLRCSPSHAGWPGRRGHSAGGSGGFLSALIFFKKLIKAPGFGSNFLQKLIKQFHIFTSFFNGTIMNVRRSQPASWLSQGGPAGARRQIVPIFSATIRYSRRRARAGIRFYSRIVPIFLATTGFCSHSRRTKTLLCFKNSISVQKCTSTLFSIHF